MYMNSIVEMLENSSSYSYHYSKIYDNRIHEQVTQLTFYFVCLFELMLHVPINIYGH